MPVVFDLSGGKVHAAGGSYSLEAVFPDGAVQVEEAVIGPLLFGQRSQLVRFAIGSPHPREAVRAGIVQAAVRAPGSLDQWALSAISLALAGAETPAPSFAETVLLVARSCGWTPDQINDALATEVDDLALQLGGDLVEASDDWTRLVFGPDLLTTLCDDMAARLLARSGPGPSQPAQPQFAGSRRLSSTTPEDRSHQETEQPTSGEFHTTGRLVGQGSSETPELRLSNESTVPQDTEVYDRENASQQDAEVNEHAPWQPPPATGMSRIPWSKPMDDHVIPTSPAAQPSIHDGLPVGGPHDDSPGMPAEAPDFEVLPSGPLTTEVPAGPENYVTPSAVPWVSQPSPPLAGTGSWSGPSGATRTERWSHQDQVLAGGLAGRLLWREPSTLSFMPTGPETDGYPNPASDIESLAYELGLMLEDEADLAGLDP